MTNSTCGAFFLHFFTLDCLSFHFPCSNTTAIVCRKKLQSLPRGPGLMLWKGRAQGRGLTSPLARGGRSVLSGKVVGRKVELSADSLMTGKEKQGLKVRAQSVNMWLSRVQCLQEKTKDAHFCINNLWQSLHMHLFVRNKRQFLVGTTANGSAASHRPATAEPEPPEVAARHCELYCALCTKHQAFLRELFAVFGSAKVWIPLPKRQQTQMDCQRSS